jgi:ribonuclease HI
MKHIVIQSDGGARGNPGPAAIGYTIVDGNITLAAVGERIGRATNNQAEYTAIHRALQTLETLGVTDATIECRLDSELVVKQLNGQYKIKDNNLAHLATEVFQVVSKLKRHKRLSVEFTHVRREQNREPDRLLNQALDSAILTSN